jgi:hypothetical protein
MPRDAETSVTEKSRGLDSPGFGFLFWMALPRSDAVPSRFYPNEAHHSSIFMLQKMAVVNKVADSIRIAKIHS